MFFLKKTRSVAIAVLAIFSILLVANGQAAAATGGAPGERDGWLPEGINGHQNLQTRGSMSEARNGGTLLRVWRSNDDQGRLWGAWGDAGVPFPLDSGARSSYSPVVAPLGNNQFAVLHTGNDGYIYMDALNANATSVDWTRLSFRTNYGPSVTRVGGDGSRQIYVAFREHDDVGHGVRGAFFDGGGWTPEQVLGGQTYSSPTVVYNPNGNRLWIVHVGVDNRPYLAYQNLGSSTWFGWTSVPTAGGLYGPLGFAVAGSGRMQLSGRAIGTNTVAFTELEANGSSLFGGWTADINHWQTQWAINLTVIAGVVYAIMTGMNSNVYYKPSFNGNPR